uniref:Uncharacterized protein n=1 Tax=Labeo catla TaxID=72446 RepID=Q9PU89_LABCA|nr:hypothetical protein [Labeo catla]
MESNSVYLEITVNNGFQCIRLIPTNIENIKTEVFA